MSNLARKLELLEGFSGKRIGVIGDLMLDRFVYGDAERLSPEAPVPVVKQVRSTIQAGGAANVGVNLVGLGAHCSLLGAIGDDPPGRQLLELLSEQGIMLTSVLELPGCATTEKTRIVARGQQMLRIDSEDVPAIRGGISGLIEHRLANWLEGLEAVAVSDYAKGVLSPDIAESLIAQCQKRDIPVIADPKPQHASAFAGASIVKPNLAEARRIAGDEGRALGPKELCEAVMAATGADSIAVTAGADGMYVLAEGSFHRVPGHPREVFDVAGAGDSALAAMALALACGASVVEAAWLGNMAGSIAVSKPGVVCVSHEDLRAEIEASHGET